MQVSTEKINQIRKQYFEIWIDFLRADITKKVTSKQGSSLVISFWFAIKKRGDFKLNRINILGDKAMFTYYCW